MTYKEIFTMLESTDLPVVYHAWKIGEVPALPYIVFTFPTNNDFMADNTNYQTIVDLNVELYTENKDFATEAIVEGVLNSNGIVYGKASMYLDSEDMFETLYNMEVIISGQ